MSASGTSLQVLSSRIFDGGESLSLSHESFSAYIDAARAGDNEAFESLALALAYTLRKEVRRFPVLTPDDARTAAMHGLFSAVSAVDDPKAFAVLAGDHVRDALKQAAGELDPIPVPTRTATRYFGILRAADGDPEVAANLCERYAMTRETFSAVRAALSVGHLDAPDMEWWGAGVSSSVEEDAEELCEAAFAALDTEQETDVVGAAYGFSDYRPHSDAEIAGDLGLSRPKVQRVRSGALVKMREALCVSDDMEV